MDKDNIISNQLTISFVETPDYISVTDFDDLPSFCYKCNFKLHHYNFEQNKYCYYNQFISYLISYEADKSPPFKA